MGVRLNLHFASALSPWIRLQFEQAAAIGTEDSLRVLRCGELVEYSLASWECDWLLFPFASLDEGILLWTRCTGLSPLIRLQFEQTGA